MNSTRIGSGSRGRAWAAAMWIALPGFAWAAEAVDPWPQLRQVMFGDRPIAEDVAGAVLTLETPQRAEDAAVVPIAIRTRLELVEPYVRKLYLIIDKNPSPVGAVFEFTPDAGRADIETRVRIEEYSNVRAIAELSDGKLHMATRYVKASGGCSAPAGKDQAAALARIGKMRFRVDDTVTPGRPTVAQLMVSHPNTSGLAMDQLTRLYEPAHFVRAIDVSYAGRRILTAEVNFTISENPHFRFYFVPQGDGELKAEVVDSKDLKFESSLRVKTNAPSGS